ncbi:hypothetical protein Q8F57_018570 [Paraburkholderia terrae]|uniref:hypothetical protein n=1 Tax=Paraburkholderia terrae TaxID=311230 RepID=UPI00296ACF7C|nr:hypothetical protein [Paraburkholderia terrae]MDW3655150.1 hypothetical protein [Paraburkholderia terrae]
MFPMNVKATEQVALLGVVSPSSQAAGAAVTGWMPVAGFQKFLALIQTGVLGAAATLDAKFQQATDSTGSGAKDITGKALTQVVKATGDNVQAEINLDQQDLDTNGGFAYIQLSLTVGAAASLTAASVFGFNPRFGPASDYNAASVAQIVG